MELARVVSWDKSPWPSRAGLRPVGRAAGVSHEAVRKWRRDHEYCRGLIWLASQELRSGQDRTKPLLPSRSKKSADANLHVYLKKNWTGPVESVLDGETYHTAEAFFAHVVDCPDAIWIGYQERVLKGMRRSPLERKRRAKLQRWWMLQTRGLMPTLRRP